MSIAFQVMLSLLMNNKNIHFPFQPSICAVVPPRESELVSAVVPPRELELVAAVVPPR